MSIVPLYSIAKTYTAAAALTGLPRESTLGELVPGLPGALRGLAMEEVLAHRSGLGDYGRWPDYAAAVEARECPWPAATILQRAAVGEPGGFAYSNIGYLLVRMALQEHHGVPLHEVLQRLILDPLGLSLLRFAEPGDWDSCTHPSIDERLRAYDPGWVYTGTLAGDPGEAARGIALILSGALGEEIPRSMLAARPVEAPGHPLGARAGYGLGLMTGDAGAGTPVAGHGGGGPGFDLFAAARADGSGWAGAALPTALPTRGVAGEATGTDRSLEVTRLVLGQLG